MQSKDETLVANINSIQAAGQAIYNDTKTFDTNFQKSWSTFIADYDGADNEGNNLPDCLKTAFANFDSGHKKEIDTVIQNREQIGTQLSGASDLIDFQDKLTAQAFANINIYGSNNYYSSGQDKQTVVDHLQPPEGFNTNIQTPPVPAKGSGAR